MIQLMVLLSKYLTSVFIFSCLLTRYLLLHLLLKLLVLCMIKVTNNISWATKQEGDQDESSSDSSMYGCAGDFGDG